jgi:hypothetical protein
VHSFLARYARQSLSALLCAAAIVAAGCHNNNQDSGFGQGWVTLTSEQGVAFQPGDFTSYIVNIDSVTLTGKTVGAITAVSTVETVDFTKLTNIAELWASASIPNDTYTQATITLDYTSAVISVMVNGKSTLATVQGPSGEVVTTVALTVNLDPANPLVITPTFASTSAVPLAIDFNLPASNYVDLSSATPVVSVRPFMTIGIQPADTKLIRVRGPLINSSVGVGTYTVEVRPFYDEVDSLGTLSLFNTPNTIYSINGSTYVGAPGITAMSKLSAGITMTAAYTTFTPSVNDLPSPPSTAGTFYPVYVIAGSTLEDQYTEGLSGFVTARNGDTLTLSGSTLILNTAETFAYCAVGVSTCNTAETHLLLGAGTIVTADDNATLKGLNSDAVSVGQYVTARGVLPASYNPAAGVVTLDATGTSSTNTGSVRLLPSEIWGSLVSSASGSLVMNLQSINDWPASAYDFAGNGATAAQNPSPAAFAVNTGSLASPAGMVAGDPVWIQGLMGPFGSAPPDFNASAVNSEASVQVAPGNGTSAGTPTPAGTQSCGVGSQVCDPASLQVFWTTTPGTTLPFTGFSTTGFSIDLTNAELIAAVIRIGPESIDVRSLPASPRIVPTTLPVTTTFAPRYTVGNPVTATSTPSVTSTTALSMYSSFPDFVTQVHDTMSSASPARQFQAQGVYNRSANTFTATSISLVL